MFLKFFRLTLTVLYESIFSYSLFNFHGVFQSALLTLLVFSNIMLSTAEREDTSSTCDFDHERQCYQKYEQEVIYMCDRCLNC